MVRIDLPYVHAVTRRRRRRNGTISTWGPYYYYRRPGAPDDGRRLPADPASAEFGAMLALFNGRAGNASSMAKSTSFAFLVDSYRTSPEFEGLKPKTRHDYGLYLDRLRGRFGQLPYAEGIDREVVFAIRDSLRATPFAANATVRVMRLLFNWARDRGWVRENPAERPRTLKAPARRQVWSPDDEAAFLAVAGAEVRLGYLLLLYTAQRLGDVLAMTWGQVADGRLLVRQEKTGELVGLPLHPDLKAALATAPRRSTHVLTDDRGRPFRQAQFQQLWRATAERAGLQGRLQLRDLRRTAAVRMAEAGVPTPQIVAVTGHRIETGQGILETYIPRNAAMADKAVKTWGRKGRRGTK